MVAAPGPLPASLYWSAVRDLVPVAALVRELDRRGVAHHHRGSRRGLVGAAAAIAWPARRGTWEAIAYRPRPRWGQARDVDAASVRRAATRLSELFLCYDRATRRLLVAPHTPCPILYGIRATTPRAAVRGRALVRSEAVDRWMLFRTNQGTGDHLGPPTRAIGPLRSGAVEGRVVSVPVAGPGGHVQFDVGGRDDRPVPCVAFEPTKTLPRVAASLVVGDRVRVWGSRGTARPIRLEGIQLLRAVERVTVTAPTCPRCGRVGRSKGRMRGYQCPGCGRRWPPEAAERRVRPPRWGPGVYLPTESARRHLSPLAGAGAP